MILKENFIKIIKKLSIIMKQACYMLVLDVLTILVTSIDAVIGLYIQEDKTFRSDSLRSITDLIDQATNEKKNYNRELNLL